MNHLTHSTYKQGIEFRSTTVPEISFSHSLNKKTLAGSYNY